MNMFFCHGFASGILFKAAASGYERRNEKRILTDCILSVSFLFHPERNTHVHLWKLLWFCPRIQMLTPSSVYVIVCRQIFSLTSIDVWQHCAESGSVSDYKSIAMGREGCDILLRDV